LRPVRLVQHLHQLKLIYYKGVEMSKKTKLIRVKLIANPGAGKTSDTANNLKMATEYLERIGLKADIALAKPKEKITLITQRAIKKGYKIVIAMGGDGTTQAVMRGMIDSKARLGIIPIGVDNFIAKRLGIPQELEEACSLIASNNTLKLDIGKVKTSECKKSVFFEMVTLGLASVIYPDTNKVAKSILSVKKDPAAVSAKQENTPMVSFTLDDKPNIDIETMVVMVCNTTDLAKKKITSSDNSPQEGPLDIMVFPDFGRTEILRYFTEESDRGYSGKKKVQHYQASKLKIKTSPKLDIMVDGVALGKGTLTIKVLKKALRVITNMQIPDQEETPKNIAIMLPEAHADVPFNVKEKIK
jgi:diacylglycerol kinase family enzyme